MSGRGLHTRGLGFAYGPVNVLRDINLSFPDRAMTAIVGTNGAGKSTLLKLLAGVISPSAGDIRISGSSMRTLSPRARAREVAFVAQEESPPHEMSVADFVSLGRLPYSARFGGLSTKDMRSIDHALQAVGASDLADHNCGDLSGGQRRRVVIARGLAQNSPFLLLDEPTNHLDVAHQHAILDLVRSLSSTVVVAIHDLDLVMGYFDRVIVVHEGGVYADGAPKQVFTPEIIENVFGVNSHIHSCDDLRHPHVLIEKLKNHEKTHNDNPRAVGGLLGVACGLLWKCVCAHGGSWRGEPHQLRDGGSLPGDCEEDAGQ